MKDMIGQELSPGDLFVMPAGNPRYGGLRLEIGIIMSMTEKRLKTITNRLDKNDIKKTTKTPLKVLKINMYSNQLFYNNESVAALKLMYDESLK